MVPRRTTEKPRTDDRQTAQKLQSSALEEQLFAQKIQALFSKLLIPLVVVVINATVLVVVLWNAIDHEAALIWLAVTVLVSVMRAGLSRLYFNCAPKPRDALRWARYFLIGVVLSGLCWGAAGIVLYVPGSLPHQVFLVFILGGMVAGATSSLSRYMPAFIVFTLPTLMPIIVVVATEWDRIHGGMAILGGIYGLAMTMIARAGGRAVNETERTRLENKNLADRLDGTNVELERRLVELKATEESLRKAESHQRAILEALPDIMFMFSTEGRVIDLYTNDPDVLHRPPEECIGKPLDEVLPSQIARETSECISTALETGALQHMEYSLETPKGIRHFEARLVRCGERQLLSLQRDITESKELEAEVIDAEKKRLEIETEARLLRASRMASLGILAAGVAHEINNPLAFIIANLSHLERELSELFGDDRGAAFSEYLSIITETQEGVERVGRVVRDLKTFSRADEDNRRSLVDIHRVLDSALRIVRNEIHHRAKLVRNYENVPLVEGNESRVVQVFVNLLVNAAQAIPEGRAHRNEIVVRTGVDEKGMVFVEVGDTGGGIPHKELPLLFEPFFTTKPPGIGTGLGLSVCHGIISDMGGTISVESEVGRGTLFRVILSPASREVETPETSPFRREKAAKKLSGKILVIDDDAPVGRSLGRLLSDHEVVIVTKAAEALELIKRDQSFDVIFCDLMMPDMTGMEVYERVQQRHQDLADRFVFMTGGAFTPKARAFVSQVPNLCLDKPFAPQGITDLVQGLLAQR